MGYKTNIKPHKTIFKRFIVLAGFYALGKGMQSASHFDKDFIEEISSLPEGFLFQMVVVPNGPAVVLKKQNNAFVFKGLKPLAEASLTVKVKNMQSAFMMIVTIIGADRAFAEHRLSVEGDIANGMRITRCMNIVQFYLFPKILSKNILKVVPKLSLNKLLGRIRIYSLGILFGY